MISSFTLKDCCLYSITAMLLLFVPSLGSTAQGPSPGSIMALVEQADTLYDNSSIETAPVLQETVMAHERYQGGTFQIVERKMKMERYPCSGCHSDKAITVKKSAELTHGSISLNHGSPGSLVCIDCHSENNRNVLEDKKGKSIDFNHSYQLCGQCHFRQKSDWLGGAHGKRVQFWTGERVILNCVSCHNPHSPRFEKRFPATYSPESP
ncbi:MAG: hypothetical protein V2I36_09745 [Desulfopila sp.]|nr:hypothetical protein [Desulfopila sp.]